MKKVFTIAICIFSFFYTSRSFAQTDTSTLDGLLHYISQPLDISQVPTHYLDK